MSIAAACFTPFVLAYQAWTYWVFRKRLLRPVPRPAPPRTSRARRLRRTPGSRAVDIPADRRLVAELPVVRHTVTASAAVGLVSTATVVVQAVAPAHLLAGAMPGAHPGDRLGAFVALGAAAAVRGLASLAGETLAHLGATRAKADLRAAGSSGPLVRRPVRRRRRPRRPRDGGGARARRPRRLRRAVPAGPRPRRRGAGRAGDRRRRARLDLRRHRRHRHRALPGLRRACCRTRRSLASCRKPLATGRGPRAPHHGRLRGAPGPAGLRPRPRAAPPHRVRRGGVAEGEPVDPAHRLPLGARPRHAGVGLRRVLAVPLGLRLLNGTVGLPAALAVLIVAARGVPAPPAGERRVPREHRRTRGPRPGDGADRTGEHLRREPCAARASHTSGRSPTRCGLRSSCAPCTSRSPAGTIPSSTAPT